MEKKVNRTSPVVRGTVADSKKDAVTVRQIPRSRRREAAGTSLSTKPDPSRKPQPQRIKTIDKRPKPRGAVGRNEATGLDQELEPELGSVFNIGSKKQSLNHLLNFSFATREFQHQGERGRDGGKGNRGKLLSTKKHKYNKEHFLQANCQFIVNDSGDYKQYLNNPDALVDWNYIEQVNVQVSEDPACPICLYPPSASKMTRCGHIYCWSCILHYLSLSDKLSRKCPVCSESINQEDLKSVVAFSHNAFNIAEDITFKLMKRPKGSLIAYPADADVKENVVFNTSEKEVYSKLLLAKNQDIFNIIEKEFKQLNHQILEDENFSEQCFIQQALLLLKERERTLLEKIKAIDMKNNEGIKDNFSQLEKSMNLVKLDNNYIKDLDEAESSSSTSPKFHYFYQANDGQHIYLHAINARMLEHAYGSLENSPKTISGIILEKEGGSMTEEIRRKLRYLQHLPLTCQFEVAEIQLKQPVVGKDTLDHFHEQIEIRRKRRQRRAKEEKRREKRIEAEENRKLGKYPAPNLHLESNIQFPEFGSGEPRLRSESESTLPSERSCSPDLIGASTSVSSEFTGPSFAMMLATQKKQPSIWPTLKPTNQSSSLPVKLINVTGSKVNTNTAVRQQSDDELEGYEHAPIFNQSLGDAIAQALEQAEKEEEHEGETPSSGKKKKKKSKQKVLFTTTMAYSGN